MAAARQDASRAARARTAPASTTVHRQQRPEDGAPAEEVEQRAADDRRERGPDAEHERDLRHHALRFGAVKAVADDGAADHEPAARRQPLQHAREPQRLDVAGDRAAERAEREHASPASTTGRRPSASDSAPCHSIMNAYANMYTDSVCCSAIGGTPNSAPDRRKRGQVHVDRERPEHRRATPAAPRIPTRGAPVRALQVAWSSARSHRRHAGAAFRPSSAASTAARS